MWIGFIWLWITVIVDYKQGDKTSGYINAGNSTNYVILKNT
jgi:hypothetical protein